MKKVIIAFILGGIIFGTIGVLAANIASSSVTYDNKKSGLTATNVKDAVDELYSKIDDTRIDFLMEVISPYLKVMNWSDKSYVRLQGHKGVDTTIGGLHIKLTASSDYKYVYLTFPDNTVTILWMTGETEKLNAGTTKTFSASYNPFIVYVDD